MLRRKFLQTLMIASSFGAMAMMSSTARASGGASGGGGGSSSGGGASSSSGGASSSSGGASSNSGSSYAQGRGASVYCDANGACTQESRDGLTPVSDNDLDSLLSSFK